MTTDEVMAEMSDYWANNFDSNWYKLFDSFVSRGNALADNADTVRDWRDISLAKGATLDMIGQDKGVPRMDDDDEFYRWLLKMKEMVFVNDPTIDNIERIVTSVFGTSNFELETKPGKNGVQITLPASVLPQDLNKRAVLLDYIQSLPAAGFSITLAFMSQTNTVVYVSVGQVVHTTTTANSNADQVG
ncbi:hypothetical protein BTI91_04320 [Lactobacillus delbrueckii subsp. bulgaricus]|nr:hypothetical protein [Lactobacillus delbrueckii subsp. bulgaricus]